MHVFAVPWWWYRLSSGPCLYCRNSIQQTKQILRNDSSIPENLLDLFAVKSFPLEFVTLTEKQQGGIFVWARILRHGSEMYVYGPSLREVKTSWVWSTCGYDPAVNRFMSHMVGTKNHSFSGVFKFFKGIKMALEKKTIHLCILEHFNFFQNGQKDRIQKRLRDLRQNRLTFTRFWGLKIDVSKGFPMHHWRLQQQRCGFGGWGGGVCYWSWTCF